ncbi:MAG: hypothetical protein IJP54_07525 [Synergistaceae bacterium]|nr:hypothetical protein [Synergistaceae bacterium]MBR0035512.1 hypothetical protein [Synergistaceae bacterium]
MRRFFAGVLAVLLLAGNVQAEEMRIIIAIKGRNLFATLEDNPASRMLYQLMPITLKMRNVYQREMSYTLPGRLPVSKLSANSLKAGDIIYWPHRNSIAVIYSHNGEKFRRQNIGHIDSGAEIFRDIKEIDVTFAPYVEPNFPKPEL